MDNYRIQELYCSECHYNGVHFTLKKPIYFQMIYLAGNGIQFENKEFGLSIKTNDFFQFQNKLGELIWFAWMLPNHQVFQQFLSENLLSPKSLQR